MRRQWSSRCFDADFGEATLKDRSVRGALLISVFHALEGVLRVVSIAILARMLEPEYFGLLSMVTAITTIAERFKDLGLSTATVQRRHITHEQVSTLFWINVTTGVALMVLMVCLSWPIAAFFREPRLVAVTMALATGFVWSGLTVQHHAILQRQMRYVAIGGIQIGSTVVSMGLAIVLALHGYGYWALVSRELARGVVVAVTAWGCCRWMPGRPKIDGNVGPLIRFGGHVTSFNMIVFLTASVDQILLGRVYGAWQLGLYRQAYQLIFGPVTQLSVPITRVAEPTLSYVQEDHARYRRCYQKMVSTINLVMMPVALFLAIYADQIVVALLGMHWGPAGPIFRLFAMSIVIGPASDTTGLLLVTTGKTKRYLALGIATGVVLVLSFGVGVLGGAEGMAWAYLIATYALLGIRLRYSFAGSPVAMMDFVRAAGRPLAASAAMTAGLLALNQLVDVNSGLLLAALALPVAIVLYLLAWLVMPGGRQQLHENLRDVIAVVPFDRSRSLFREWRRAAVVRGMSR